MSFSTNAKIIITNNMVNIVAKPPSSIYTNHPRHLFLLFCARLRVLRTLKNAPAFFDDFSPTRITQKYSTTYKNITRREFVKYTLCKLKNGVASGIMRRSSARTSDDINACWIVVDASNTPRL